MRRVLDSGSQLARLAATRDMQPAARDWLLERGFLKIRAMNANRRAGVFSFVQDVPAAYVTPAGRTWFHSTAGAGVALLVLARAAVRLSIPA